MPPKKHTHKLLSGETISIGWLLEDDILFLEELKVGVREGEDYFSLLRRVIGPEAYPLKEYDGNMTEEVSQSVLFKVANDIVERAGIGQGRLVCPTDEPDIKNLISTKEACKILGVTRAGLHFLLTNGKIKGWKIGSRWLVDRVNAEQNARSRAMKKSS